MGLHKASDRSQERLRFWALPVFLAAICLLAAIGAEDARALLKYDRLAIEAGEWWRLVSGHFVHLGWSHLALNIAGLLLVWILVGSAASPVGWALVTAWTVALISGGFWLLDEYMLWYVGLSGVLHGLLVAGAIGCMHQRRGESLILLGLVFLKLVYEQVVGPLPGSEASSGGPVVVNAHLYGGVAGLLAGLVLWRRGAPDKSI